MLVVRIIDSPELPVDRCVCAYRKVQFEALQAICADFAEMSFGTTQLTDSCHRYQATEPRVDQLECTGCLAGAVRCEPAGLDPLRTDVEHEADFWIELRNDPVLIIGPLQVPCRHHAPGPAGDHGAYWAGPLQVCCPNCEAQLPSTRGAIKTTCVDADHEATGSNVLVAKHRPAIGCGSGYLGNLTGLRRACYLFTKRGIQPWRMSSEIDAPNECPTMNLKTVTVPAHALDAAGESSLAIPQL
jgi:hypothetical protein